MDLHKLYNNICSRGKLRGLDYELGYEIHHVIPRSFSGSDDPSNLTKLTYREHFIVHHILAKLGDYRMICAFTMMRSLARYKVNITHNEFSKIKYIASEFRNKVKYYREEHNYYKSLYMARTEHSLKIKKLLNIEEDYEIKNLKKPKKKRKIKEQVKIKKPRKIKEQVKIKKPIKVVSNMYSMKEDLSPSKDSKGNVYNSRGRKIGNIFSNKELLKYFE